MLTVYAFNDYRKYLKAYYEGNKSQKHGFSYRRFADRARLKSSNYLKLVIDGERRLTDYYLDNFIQALALKPDEADYFRQLVKMNNCTDPERKAGLIKGLLKHLVHNKVGTVNPQEMLILEKWYVWVIREMVNLSGFSDDPSQIARRLYHMITPAQAKTALHRLLNAGLITKKAGGYQVKDNYFTTQDDVLSLAIVNLMGEMLNLSQNALHQFNIAEREISGLTLAIKEDDFTKIKEEVKQFRRHINLKYSSSAADNVFQLNLQFFPLTQKV